jgi:hypothetical protein
MNGLQCVPGSMWPKFPSGFWTWLCCSKMLFTLNDFTNFHQIKTVLDARRFPMQSKIEAGWGMCSDYVKKILRMRAHVTWALAKIFIRLFIENSCHIILKSAWLHNFSSKVYIALRSSENRYTKQGFPRKEKPKMGIWACAIYSSNVKPPVFDNAVDAVERAGYSD